MRSFDYARTAPEPPEGALVFAVRLVVAFMARAYAGDFAARQWPWARSKAELRPSDHMIKLTAKVCAGTTAV